MATRIEWPFLLKTYAYRLVSGERAGTRTQDPRIKSALLYHLSYALSPFFKIITEMHPLPLLTGRVRFPCDRAKKETFLFALLKSLLLSLQFPTL